MASELKLQLTRWVAVMLLLAAGVAAFGSIFTPDRFLVAGGIGALAGLTIAAMRLQWFMSIVVTIVVALAMGPLATHRSSRLDSMIPTPATELEFVRLAATAFKRIVMINLPEINAQFGMLAVPYLTALGAAVLAGTALRYRNPLGAFLSASLPLLVAILVGTQHTVQPAAIGAVFGLGAILLLVVQKSRGGRGFVWRTTRLVSAVIILAVAAGAGLAVAPLITGDDRQVLRDYIPGDTQPYDYTTPLAKFRYYRTALKDTTLMTVDGFPVGERVRVAVMDRYDGNEYHVAGSDKPNDVSGTFGPYTTARSGSSAATANLPQGNFVNAHIAIDGYSDVWVPGPARINWLTCDGPRMQDVLDGLYFNQVTGTAMTTVGLRNGDSVNVGGTLAVVPTQQQLEDATFAPITLPPDQIPAVVATMAANLTASAARPIDKVLALQGYLQQGGFYNGGDKVMPVGHDAARIVSFLTSPQIVGDDEQYAVAMALMANAVGIPARVVAGFQVAPGRNTITGDDARAWVEVAFDHVGWVQFDPAPPRDKVPPAPPMPGPPPDQQPPPSNDQQAQHQPPPPVEKAIETIKAKLPNFLVPLLYVVVVLVKSLLILAVPVLIGLTIVLLKRRRRQRRRLIADPSQRIAAGWREVADTAIDFGVPRDDRGTRLEMAARAARVTPEAGLVPLARLADADSFSPPVPNHDLADAYWAEVDNWRAELRRAVPASQLLRQGVSLRSFTASKRARRTLGFPTTPWTSRLLAGIVDLVLYVALLPAPLIAAGTGHTGWRVAIWLTVGLIYLPLVALLAAETGQSVGKRLFNVRTEMASSGKHTPASLNVGTVLARVALHNVLQVFLLAGMWSILLRGDRRGWHDLVTGTRVVPVERDADDR